MIIHPAGSRPSATAPADYFTGAVRLDPLINTPAPARLRGLSVTFEPGARTAWHTHPLGQTLIVTAGIGLVQRDGGAPVGSVCLAAFGLWIAAAANAGRSGRGHHKN